MRPLHEPFGLRSCVNISGRRPVPPFVVFGFSNGFGYGLRPGPKAEPYRSATRSSKLSGRSRKPPQVSHSELYCAAVSVDDPNSDSGVVGSLPVKRAPTPFAPVSSSLSPR